MGCPQLLGSNGVGGCPQLLGRNGVGVLGYWGILGPGMRGVLAWGAHQLLGIIGGCIDRVVGVKGAMNQREMGWGSPVIGSSLVEGIPSY